MFNNRLVCIRKKQKGNTFTLKTHMAIRNKPFNQLSMNYKLVSHGIHFKSQSKYNHFSPYTKSPLTNLQSKKKTSYINPTHNQFSIYKLVTITNDQNSILQNNCPITL